MENGYQATACRMRTFGKFPTVEYWVDNLNAVPFINECSPNLPFRIAAPYPFKEDNGFFALDPTRRLENIDFSRFHFFPRDKLEMYHMTLVRRDIKKKLRNVSNRGNYGNLSDFWEKWDAWTPDSKEILHPHPHIGKYFTEIRLVPNYFNIDLDKQCRVCCITTENLMRCSVCKTAKYCSSKCQNEDWPTHKKICSKTS